MCVIPIKKQMMTNEKNGVPSVSQPLLLASLHRLSFILELAMLHTNLLLMEVDCFLSKLLRDVANCEMRLLVLLRSFVVYVERKNLRFSIFDSGGNNIDRCMLFIAVMEDFRYGNSWILLYFVDHLFIYCISYIASHTC